MESKIDESELVQLMDMCKAEYPDIDPYCIWVYSVQHLMEQNGYTVDKEVEKELMEKAKKSLETKEFNFKVVN
jgi:hypothetical protein